MNVINNIVEGYAETKKDLKSVFKGSKSAFKEKKIEYEAKREEVISFVYGYICKLLLIFSDIILWIFRIGIPY
jgi:hypothetical protein